jgi:hypothetical protein
MGFRNKLTRLSPAQLDTMVVRNLATAASGPRIVLSSGDQQSALFYSGTTGEVGPGEIDVGIISDTRGAGTSPPADVARLYLTPPAIGSGHIGDVSLELRSPTRDGAPRATRRSSATSAPSATCSSRAASPTPAPAGRRSRSARR